MPVPEPPAMLRLSCIAVLIALASIGCGGGDGGDTTGPGDAFPDVSGVYNVQGGFDGLTSNEASFVGSLSFNQTSRQSGELTGTMSVTATINGEVITAGTAPIQASSVTPSGTVSFQLGNLSTGGTWTFSGTASGDIISGRHTLTDGANSFSGNWTATTGAPSNGSLTVTVATSGASLDPDGYTLVVDGGNSGLLTGGTPLTVSGLAPGNHSVGLAGVADNCQVQGENPRLVLIASGGTATASFSVSCVTPLPSTGTIQVTAATSGADGDADGYLATLDGAGPGNQLAANGSTTFINVAAGSHTVALSGVAPNCTADSPSKTATVTSGATATVAFAVTCTAVPPSTGSIHVTTTTTGSDLDPDGYEFALDGGAHRTIAVSGSETVNNVAAGSHTVVLSDIAANCSVDGAESRNVPVTGGQTAEVAFSITCAVIAPSATRSEMVADPKTIAAGTGSSTITVTVRGSDGQRLDGIPVSLSSSGDGNTITATSGTTDAEGEATFTFSSTVAGDKTITATAGGVTLEDTEVISVFTRGSTTEITSIAPEPSTPGAVITVTVRVTGEGGGTPTGTVSVFAPEAGAGCSNAPINPEGVAVCEFALDEVGDYTIQAAYFGDNQFDESSDLDGAHRVAVPTTSNQRASR